MGESFETVGDEMPSTFIWGDRKKLIHTVGTVAKVEWQVKNDIGYTGIFEGAEHGYIRMSFAAQPSPNLVNTTPGIGVKFLRDGVDSANFVAMYSVDGHDTWNWFANSFSNHIPAAGPALIPLATKFATWTKYVQQVGLSDMASFAENG